MLIASHINNILVNAIKLKIIENEDYYYYFNNLCTKVKYEFINEKIEFLNCSVLESADFLAEKIDCTKVNLYSNYILDTFIVSPSILNSKKENYDFIDYYYKLCVFSNYINEDKLNSTVKFYYLGINITINTSKPEIINSGKLNSNKSDYPLCSLCVTNVGFFGKTNNNPRSSLRTISILLNNRKWHMQFSPYQYFTKHLIVISDKHSKMCINDDTIDELLDFNDLYNNYFIGCNGDIPIVGGSILEHKHYQAGEFNFMIEKSSIRCSFEIDNVDVEYLNWYVQAIRIKSKCRIKLKKILNNYRINFKQYKNSEIGIYNLNNNNTVNIITRKEQDLYIAYLIFRNNDVNKIFPFGIFHPNESLHHIKKENIGLIEAMGMAILPKRVMDNKYNYIGEKFILILKSCDIFRFSSKLNIENLIKQWAN